MIVLHCPYCGTVAERVTGREVYPHRPDLYGKKLFVCRPCDARCGTHPDGTPLGRLANAELRKARNRAHAIFDPLWKSGRMHRSEAYRWLRKITNLSRDECHIAMMDIETVTRTIEALLNHVETRS